MRRDTVIRVLLLLLGVPNLLIGVWARVAPQSWYDDFPGLGRHWIPPHGPFNLHFIEDYGAAMAGFGVLLILAAYYYERRLVLVALIAWEVQAIPHFYAHIRERGIGTSDSDYALNVFSVGLTAVVPLIVIAMLAARGWSRAAPR